LSVPGLSVPESWAGILRVLDWAKFKVGIGGGHPSNFRKCGKQRRYKSFVFVSAANKGVTGTFLVSAVNKRLSGNATGNWKIGGGEIGRGGVARAVGRERVRKVLKRKG
jgi:hypothetical protein